MSKTPWGHFSFIVLSIFVKFLSFQDVTLTFWRVTLSFQRVILLSRKSWCSNFHHTTYESTCDTLPSSAANQGDNIVSVAQGGTAIPGATKQLLPPDRVFKRNVYLYIRQIYMSTLAILRHIMNFTLTSSVLMTLFWAAIKIQLLSWSFLF